jgi:enoyl-CoA hydratase/carnithine racemase
MTESGSHASGLSVVDTGAIRTITIDRDHRRNALDGATLLALVDALTAADHESEVRAIVLTGVGDVAFCAGIDLKEPEPVGATPGEREEFRGRLAHVFRVATTLGRPIVTRVNGLAFGAGFGLAMAGDIVVAADHARFACPEIDVGRFPIAVGAMLLRFLPTRVVLELCMTGRELSAAQALDMHAVNRVVARSELDATVHDIATRLASKPPGALGLGRRALYRMRDIGIDAALDEGLGLLEQVVASEEAETGRRKFLASASGGGQP